MILLSDCQNILAGKIPYVPKWPLTIHIRPVLVKNFEIYDIDEASNYVDLDDYKKISITVAHNNEVRVKERLGAPITRTFYVHDNEALDHTLTVAMHEKTDDHSCFVDGISITVAVEVQVEIDNIPVSLLFFNMDSCLISESNKDYTANFQTPIYHYLIENRGLILKRWIQELSN